MDGDGDDILSTKIRGSNPGSIDSSAPGRSIAIVCSTTFSRSCAEGDRERGGLWSGDDVVLAFSVGEVGKSAAERKIRFRSGDEGGLVDTIYTHVVSHESTAVCR